MTKIFASNFNEKLAQRYYNLILLPSIRGGTFFFSGLIKAAGVLESDDRALLTPNRYQRTQKIKLPLVAIPEESPLQTHRFLQRCCHPSVRGMDLLVSLLNFCFRLVIVPSERQSSSAPSCRKFQYLLSLAVLPS